MPLLFEIIRRIFFCATILMIIFIIVFVIAEPDRLTNYQMETAQQILMPAYLVIIWIVLWYILNLIGERPSDAPDIRYNNATTAFVQWIAIGIFLALLYMFSM